MLKLKEIEKIELWAVTVCIILSLVFSTIQAMSNHYYPENFWTQLFFSYFITCICYLILFFFVQPELSSSEKRSSTAIIVICMLIDICFITGVINAYLGVLLSIKMLMIYFNVNRQHSGPNPLSKEALLLFACAMFIHGNSLLLESTALLITYFSIIVPVAILHYLYLTYNLLPNATQKRYAVLKFIGITLVTTLVSYFFIGFLIFAIGSYRRPDDTVEIILALNFLTQFIIVPLFAWNIYKHRNQQKAEEIKILKTELGKSDATLNFLKSQINPHFLFNALNTLYGTALQEQAERTSEGIQKLGDMMRFMLQENLEDKILLSRDVEYLKNYIDLQKLRTSISTDVVIETQIEEQLNDLKIAPMLLIPFVENAFKHGISLQYPSHIKITLQTSSNTLYFDVHNSIHLKPVNDPEKLESGIGLNNVKQRLVLQYPEKHELIIRENAKEFFIHLTLQL